MLASFFGDDSVKFGHVDSCCGTLGINVEFGDVAVTWIPALLKLCSGDWMSQHLPHDALLLTFDIPLALRLVEETLADRFGLCDLKLSARLGLRLALLGEVLGLGFLARSVGLCCAAFGDGFCLLVAFCTLSMSGSAPMPDLSAGDLTPWRACS